MPPAKPRKKKISYTRYGLEGLLAMVKEVDDFFFDVEVKVFDSDLDDQRVLLGTIRRDEYGSYQFYPEA